MTPYKINDAPLSIAIIAGGLATRLHPLTEKIPKSLVQICGEPFIAHQLRLLKEQGIQDTVLCLGYKGELVQEFVGNGSRFGLRVSYAYDGPKLSGTAGALHAALPYLGEHFFTLYGDSYLACDYASVQRTYTESGKLGLMTVFRNEGSWDTSNVEFADGKIVAYDKQHRNTRMHYIDYGLGIFHRSVFEHIPKGETKDLAAVYQELLAENQLAAFEVHERFYEVGSFDGLRDLENFLSRKK